MQEHLTAQSMNGNIQVEEVRLPIQHVASAIESLLFVSGRPLEHAELRKLLNIDDARLASSLQVLADNLESQGRGIRLQRLGEHVQLVTAPENARYVAALLGLPMTAKLTTAAMETLAVVSYHTRADRVYSRREQRPGPGQLDTARAGGRDWARSDGRAPRAIRHYQRVLAAIRPDRPGTIAGGGDAGTGG